MKSLVGVGFTVHDSRTSLYVWWGLGWLVDSGCLNAQSITEVTSVSTLYVQSKVTGWFLIYHFHSQQGTTQLRPIKSDFTSIANDNGPTKVTLIQYVQSKLEVNVCCVCVRACVCVCVCKTSSEPWYCDVSSKLWSWIISRPCLIPRACTFYLTRDNKDILIIVSRRVMWQKDGCYHQGQCHSDGLYNQYCFYLSYEPMVFDYIFWTFVVVFWNQT